MEKEKNLKIPKNFFTKPRPHVIQKENKKDMIPFKWSSDVMSGQKKAILYSVKKIND